MILVPAIVVCPGGEYCFVKKRFVTISPRFLLQIQYGTTARGSEDTINEELCIPDAAAHRIPRVGRWVKKLPFLNDNRNHTQYTKFEKQERKTKFFQEKRKNARREVIDRVEHPLSMNLESRENASKGLERLRSFLVFEPAWMPCSCAIFFGSGKRATVAGRVSLRWRASGQPDDPSWGLGRCLCGICSRGRGGTVAIPVAAAAKSQTRLSPNPS